MKINVVCKCYCCEDRMKKTLEHLFLTSPIAKRLWRYFASSAGVNMEDMHLHQIIHAKVINSLY